MSQYVLQENGEVCVCSFCHYGTEEHSHNYLELAYIEDGCATHVLEGEEAFIQKGSYFIIDYDMNHQYTSMENRPVSIINCLFTPSLIDRSLKKCRKFSDLMGNYMIRINYSTLRQNPTQTIFQDDDGRIYRLVKNIQREYEEKNNGYHEVIRSNLIEIIIITMRKISDRCNERLTADDMTRYVMQYVENNYMDCLRLSAIAKELNYSLPYLSLRFKQECGETFNHYVQRYRVEQSCRLLKNTDKKVIAVAQMVGYNDLKYFNTVFKKIMGMTPQRFRRL